MRKSFVNEKCTAKVLNQVADSIHPMISFTSDTPSNHTDGLMPVLDLKVKLDDENDVHFEYFEKKTTNSRVILASSALPWRTKETILVNEAVRRLRNTSTKLGPAVQDKHLTKFMAKLQRSGYDDVFRANVIKRAKSIYSLQVDRDVKGIKPLYRSRKQIENDRLTNPKSKSEWWKKDSQPFNTVIFVPPTPGGKLAKMLREKEKQLGENSKIRIKILESGGLKVKNILCRNDPFPTKTCETQICPLCHDTPYSKVGDLKPFRTHCLTPGVGYRVECGNCKRVGIKASYEGETGRPVKVRLAEHITDLHRQAQSSPLVKHQTLYHSNQPEDFKFSVTGKFKDALSRQANEGVRISRLSKDHIILNSKSEFNHPPTNRITIEKRRHLNP